MLINRVPEEASGRAGDAEMQNLEDTSTVLQTAEEIYQIMAKSNNFEGDGDKALTARDLVILYKNIDIDTKLISTAKQQISKSSNQYVENVIHNDDRGSEGSDVSEDISNEDFNHVFAINEERIGLLNNFGDTLCHKFGDMQMRTSDLATEYNRHFLFNDPFIKEQLKSFHEISKSKHSDSTVLPASLLDYICCKRIEDNYNFYMDNIIKYVQNTIEHLKRISNGDYLSEKAKEKWREVYEDDVPTPDEPSQQCKKTILASSVSIPLRVKDKRTDQRITWDDIVHSEMDVRSLSKILEKKVIVEVPKIICGTYRLFSKRCKDNLIITCKKHEEEQESRVDVVLKLQRSKSGQVISNIDSIMILKSLPTIATEAETRSNDLLAVEFEKVNAIDVNDEKSEIKLDAIQIDDDKEEIPPNDTADYSLASDREAKVEKFSEDDYDFLPQSDSQEDDEYGSSRAEADFNTIATDDLHSIIHQLSKQTPVIEESEDSMKKKKSPMRVRIKSPYENKSYVMEEKKRKKLLEIREKREHKKNVISENRRITKHRYGRGATMVQASNSVTKLSITNKQFYNSIYGQSMNINMKNSQKYYKDQTRDCIPEIELGNDEETHYYDARSPPSLVSPEKNSQKYINRSYYLDDAETEVMHLQMKENENQDLTKDTSSASATTNDIGVSLNLLEQFIAPSTTEFSLTDTLSSLQQNILCDDRFVNTEKEMTQKNAVMSTRSTQVSVPKKSLKIEASTQEENGKTTTSVECRRSIDKIYELIKQIDKTESLEVITTQSKTTNNIDQIQVACGRVSSSTQASDSGTSIQHQLTSVNPSCCSFGKANTVMKTSKDTKKKNDNPISVIPKVKISSKLPPNNKFNNKSDHKELRKLSGSKIQENPLKAISQLIHEFDNVQKMIVKSEKESKKNKRSDSLATQDKSSSRQHFQRIPKQDQNLMDSEAISSKNSVLKDRRRQSTGYGSFINTQRQVQPEENILDTTSRKKITDIIDEVKELRGEAVRGPSKKLARLNSLAQPKKPYLQSQQEDPQNRFRKPVIDRQSKPTPPVTNPERSIASTRTKHRKITDGLPTSTKQPLTPGSPSERYSKAKPPTHNSPNREGYNKRFLGPVAKLPLNHGNVNKTPEKLKGKMVAVETYVKSHYGREGHALEIGDSTNAHKSRVPLIPNDLDVASSASSPSTKEESTTLGKKLHHMIDSMISSTVPVLSAVAECNESVSKEGDAFDDIYIEGRTKSDEIILSGSDYPVDIFEDKNIVTAVSIISQDHKDVEVANDSNSNTNICETNLPCPPNDLPNTENAICRQISNGSFQKSLRIKNFTTPKQSMVNLLILQSGDSNSLVVKPKISQHKDFKSETISELKILPALSNTRFTDFSFTNFPMQIATGDYALPHLIKFDSKAKISLIENEDSKSNNITTVKSSENTSNTPLSKSNHCFKGTVKKTSQELIQRESVISQLTNKNMNKVVLENCGECAIHVEKYKERKAQDNTVETKTIDEDIVAVDIKKSNISNSTSLDILVGLLNEIKKITTFQALPKQEETQAHTEFENKELEIILNNVSIKESSVAHIADNALSLHSLDNLRILEARASNFFYLSNSNVEDNKDKKMSDKNIKANTKVLYEPLNVDKEVNAKIWQNECRHRFTEAPSQLLPVSVSTNVTESLMKLINKSSSRSIYSITDSESFTSLVNEIKEKPSNASETFCASPPAILKIQYISDKEKYADVKNGPNGQTLVEFDPLMKMKRDILVTVYSILVFTVFAALSFPEIMYRL